MANLRCSVGEHIDELCFSETFVKHSDYSVLSVERLDAIDVKTISYRANLLQFSSICLHHHQAFTAKFHVYRKSKKCANLFGNHKTNCKLPKGNKSPSLKMCESIKKTQPNLHVFPGQKLCPNCYMNFLRVMSKNEGKLSQCSSSNLSELSEFEDCEAELNTISLQSDTSFGSPLTKSFRRSVMVTSALEVTPVKIDTKKSKSARLNVIKRKANEIQTAFIKLHEPFANIVPEKLNTSEENAIMVNDYEMMMRELKERCEKLKDASDYSGILTLLTLAPQSWSLQRTAEFFNVSISQVKQSRILKNEKGILATPDKKKGRKLTEDETEIIKDFYLADENSRMQPGMNDYVSVRINPGEKKVKLQKQLLLMNIDELYYKFKEHCVTKLCMKACGRSKFFSLRPVNVIEVGGSGTHNVL
jgi:hypothetical protein